MKKYLLFIYLIFNSLCFGQPTLEVTYKTYLFDNEDDNGAFEYSTGHLICDSKQSVYTIHYRDTLIITASDSQFESSSEISPTILVKDVQAGTVTYSAPYMRQKLVVDSEVEIKWTLTGNKKQILNYSCLEAKTDWRGRSYVAYFSPDIPIQSGPFKFSGLPGLILEVRSSDNALTITALSVTKYTLPIKIPPLRGEAMSWSEFRKAYRKYFDSVNNLSLGENYSASIPKRFIEVLID